MIRRISTPRAAWAANAPPTGKASSSGWAKQTEAEYAALREAKAFETIRELFNTLAEGRDDADTLAARVAAGPVEQAGPPAPKFVDLVQRLAVAGIQAELQGEKLTFRFARPQGATLQLVRPVPHPWLRQRKLAEIGVFEGLPEYGALAEANARMARMVESHAPESLTGKAFAQLETRVKECFDALLTPAHLQFGARVLFSGRTVIAPAADLRIDQLGLAEEIAWTLFGPMVTRELGSEEEVHTRSERATQVLDTLMARAWVILYRAPALMTTSFLAFHPVRRPERVIRLHPLACEMMNADFDGDQAAVFLPVTEAGQREAGARLSIAAHLRRDPELIRSLPPKMDAVFGLASLSLSSKGRKEIAKLAGTEVAREGEIVTRQTLVDALRNVLERDGAQKALEASERLMRRGFEVAKESGPSMNPFLGASMERPPEPEDDDPDQWSSYTEEIIGRIASHNDFSDNDLGPLCLLVQSGARANHLQLARLVGALGMCSDVRGKLVPIRHGWRDGLTPEEMYTTVVGAREGLARLASELGQMRQGLRDTSAPAGFHVLARARRAKRPGIVFARAAATNETDPLTDVDSRLFVGFPVKARG